MGWQTGISNDDYHRGQELKEHFGSTDIRNFIRSPAHCRWNKDYGADETPAMHMGTVFHARVLEPDSVVIEPEVNKRSKSGKADLKAFREKNAGKVIASRDEFELAQQMAGAIKSHRFARTLLEAPGEIEVTGVFREPTYGIKGKIRVDKLNRDDRIMVDLKSTTDASEEYYQKAIFNWGLDIQGCWYNLGGHQIDNFGYEFILIVVEKTPPFGVNTFRLTDRHFEIAYRKIDGILDQLNRCIEKNHWPGYPQKIINPEIPAWEIKKYHN